MYCNTMHSMCIIPHITSSLKSSDRVHGASGTLPTSGTYVGANPVVSLLAESWTVVDGGRLLLAAKWETGRTCVRR